MNYAIIGFFQNWFVNEGGPKSALRQQDSQLKKWDSLFNIAGSRQGYRVDFKNAYFLEHLKVAAPRIRWNMLSERIFEIIRKNTFDLVAIKADKTAKQN